MTSTRMRTTRCLAVLGITAAVVVLPAATAGAIVTGPCTGTIKGVDVSDRSATSPKDAIEVGGKEDVVVGATSQQKIERYKVQLEFAGVRWTVGKGTTTDTSWSKTVNVAHYARYGVGLYKVHGVSEGAAACDGAALVKVGGSPLGTIAGLAGIGLAGLGAATAAATSMKTAMEGEKPAKRIYRPDGAPPDQAAQAGFGEVRSPADYVRWVESCAQGPSVPPDVIRAICDRGADQIQSLCTKGLAGVTW